MFLLPATVVTFAGTGLMSSAPSRPGEQGVDGVFRVEEQGVEQSPELVDGQLDHAGGRRCVIAFDGGGDGEEGVGEHREGGPAVPGGPASDLVLVEADEAFGGLEGFFDAP